MFLTLTAVSAIIGLLYYFFTRNFDYWKKRNVPGPKPVPFYGNLFESTIRRTTVGQVIKKIYDSYPNEKVVGVYRMTTPCLLIKDLDLVKHVMIKDFDNFVDRGIEFSKEGLGSNLFHSDGDTWRVLRNRFTPIFTSGKLKNMMYLLVERGDRFNEYVKEITDKNLEQELHSLVQKYTMSTITACAFGLDIDTFRGEIESLKRVDREIFTAHFVNELDMMFPGILKTLNMSIFPEFMKKFFKELVNTVVNERGGKPSNRKDFMDLILEMRNDKTIQGVKKSDDDKDRELEITNSVIEAQAFLFYAAGYETSASTMGFLLYQLALNPDIQDKLRAEIDDYLKKNDGQLSMNILQDLPYLGQAIEETLRMYPIVETLQRNAQSDYVLPGTNVEVKKGQTLLISPYGIQRDPKHYPNPEKFDPDRFTPENVAKRHSCAWLPFGLGPRHCIGMRFAQVQTRVCVIKLLSKFRLEANKNTPRTFKYDPRRLVLSPVGGFPVNIIPRD